MERHKLLAAAACMAALCSPAIAEEPDAQSYCSEQSRLAGAMMTARQTGTPMSEAMEAAGSNKALQVFTMIAYEVPAYKEPGNQAEAITEFENLIFAECFKRKNPSIAP